MSLHLWGSNANHQLGMKTASKATAEPTLVSALDGHQVISCAAGEYHTIVATEWGDVYAWGRGKEGQVRFSDFAACEINVIFCYMYALARQSRTGVAADQAQEDFRSCW